MDIIRGKEEHRKLILQLRLELWPHHSREALNEEITKIFNSNDYFIYIGFENNDPIGFIEFSIRKYAPGSEGQEIPYIEGWCISSKYRGKEYGKNLMRFAEKWAKQQGYSKLASDTTTNYPGSLEAHRAVGFTEVKTMHHFIKEIQTS